MENEEILDSFLRALKEGKLQYEIHGSWFDVDLENITLGYMLRKNKFRIVDKDTPEEDYEESQFIHPPIM